jgi:mono/diheme cytochrome c family protein
MKGTLPALFLALSLPLVAAGGLGDAELRNGDYRPAEMGNIQQAAPAELSTDSTYEVSAYPMFAPELAAGDGKQEVESYCAMCHSPRYITMQPPLPAATWEAEVNKMNKAYGAAIPDGVSQKIVQYLQTNYTPETRKR